MEDGGSVSKRTAGVKRSSQALDAANSFGSILGESMKESISMMTNVLVREQQPAPGTHLETNKFSYLDNINKAMSVIERLDAQIETMKEKGASRRRIKILNGARERAYACLGDDKDTARSSSSDDESSWVSFVEGARLRRGWSGTVGLKRGMFGRNTILSTKRKLKTKARDDFRALWPTPRIL